jgi:hypothetical protein
MSGNSRRDTRHITLVRALHARLYVNGEGRIFVATCQVAHNKLAQTLALHDRWPTVAEAPTPFELGVSTCDGELSTDLLHAMNRGLNRWRLELAAEMRCRPARRRRTAALVREQEEIERLTARLAEVLQWREKLACGGELTGAPYFLDTVAEAELNASLDEASRACPLSPLVAWQARVVFWLSGECATRRFLSALANVIGAYPAVSCDEQLHRFERAVTIWRDRSFREGFAHLRLEMAQHIRRLPPTLVCEGKLSSRLHNQTFREHCDRLVERCHQVSASRQRHREHLIPASLAALAAADRCTVSLPKRCLTAAARLDDYAQLVRSINRLSGQIGEPGYAAMLEALDQLPASASVFNYRQLCDLLGRGNTLADYIWANDRGLLPLIRASQLSIATVRRLNDAFSVRACPLSEDDLSALVSRICEPNELERIEAWLKWLGWVSPRTLTPVLSDLVQSTFQQLYFPSVAGNGWFAELLPCIAVPQRRPDRQDIRPLLDRIAACQELIGKKHAIPKALRKLLDSEASRSQEYERLRAVCAAGTLDSSAQRRLEYLERNQGGRPNSNKIRRVAEESFLRSGIEAMETIVRRLTEDMCREHLHELGTRLSRVQLGQFARWIGKMSEPERQRLRTVIAAHARHGHNYKRHLDENHPWIDGITARGFDLEPWFAAHPHIEIVSGQILEIGPADDLLDLFLMGTNFDTCLALGKENDLSVLANAYHANKQVVFMVTRGAAGTRTVARQIIAVSSDDKLLKYHCYTNSHHSEESPLYQDVANAMASYAARLAAECSLELADQGTPQGIEGHFWYDDGPCEWSAAARQVWKEARKQNDVALVCG